MAMKSRRLIEMNPAEGEKSLGVDRLLIGAAIGEIRSGIGTVGIHGVACGNNPAEGRLDQDDS